MVLVIVKLLFFTHVCIKCDLIIEYTKLCFDIELNCQLTTDGIKFERNLRKNKQKTRASVHKDVDYWSDMLVVIDDNPVEIYEIIVTSDLRQLQSHRSIHFLSFSRSLVSVFLYT